MSSNASGMPTKDFFVGMLTRDIELNDAILDLLDNCLDGVVRSRNDANKSNDKNFYKGFFANITVEPDKFVIEDNCGGIPRGVAEKYAFRMGGSPGQLVDLPTVGIYGIGMKRAIFKIGREAFVHTKTAYETYSVNIPSKWVSSDNWDFPIINNHSQNNLTNKGTSIIITSLNSDIAELWNNKNKIELFVDKLKQAIKESYSRIIEKGFKITINTDEVDHSPVELLVAENDDNTGIRPFLFSQKYDSVTVKLAIGFYAPPPSQDEIDDMNETKRSSTDAGITIICNDRVVLYNDKSYLTGWGVNGVPQYHTQFIGIKGVVTFESNDPKKLPMTTTKRGIDHSSSIYVFVKDRICEGLKTFTNYTNKWKGRNTLEREYSEKTTRISYDQLFEDNKSITMHAVKDGKKYKPALPMPPNDKPYRIIRYSRDLSEIKMLIAYFYGDEELEVSPSLVGEKSFDEILKIAKEATS